MLQTPDVQKTIGNLFSGAHIWLDASIVLPMLGETLLESQEQQFSATLSAATQAGVRFFVTPGVIEEVERHLHRCHMCHVLPGQEWQGPVPFLYSLFISSGRSRNEFPKWLEQFIGSVRPEDDLADYLSDDFGIQRESLSIYVDQQPEDIRFAVQTIWQQVHEKRRNDRNGFFDDIAVLRLAKHDVENYLGVIGKRENSKQESMLGHIFWWLTLDRAAYRLDEELKKYLTRRSPSSPVMSPDFLLRYLTIGPMRDKVAAKARDLPITLFEVPHELIPVDLIQVAEKLREELASQPERLIRRKVRDKLDEMRSNVGPIANAGSAGVEKRLQDSLKNSSRRKLKRRGST